MRQNCAFCVENQIMRKRANYLFFFTHSHNHTILERLSNDEFLKKCVAAACFGKKQPHSVNCDLELNFVILRLIFMTALFSQVKLNMKLLGL